MRISKQSARSANEAPPWQSWAQEILREVPSVGLRRSSWTATERDTLRRYLSRRRNGIVKALQSLERVRVKGARAWQKSTKLAYYHFLALIEQCLIQLKIPRDQWTPE